MPKKHKGKKGKKGKKKSGKKSAEQDVGPVDPMAPSYVPPPPKPGDQLIKLLTSHPVNEKEVHGVKVSTRILENLTPQEIRDLRVVFELFDTNDDGYLCAPELRRAMKALGFRVSRDEAKQLTVDGSLKGKGMLDFNEFLETVIDRQGDSRDMHDEILKGFALFDQGKKGAICLDDLKKACELTGTRFTEEELKDMIEEADINGDGKKGAICLDDLKKACELTGTRFTEEELKDMIEEADINGDGHVDQSEFVRIMLRTNLF